MDPNAILVDPELRSIPLKGFPLAIVVTSVIFFSLSALTVAFRSFSRWKGSVFGWDDGLMLAGTIIYASVTGTAIYACKVGIGSRAKYLNPWLGSESMKWYIIWILQYVGALALVKSSICVTIFRIAGTQRYLRNTVWALLGLTWASFFVTFIGTLLYCQPTEALWTPTMLISGEGKCGSPETFVAIGHVATSTTIVTDLALAVLPGVILWNTQMKKAMKLQVFGLLSFASVASIITIVRIPFVNKFKSQDDLQFWVAHIMLFSNIETGIGCITSSIPSLRRLVRGTEVSTNDRTTGLTGNKPSEPGHGTRDRYRNPTDGGFSLTTVKGRADDKWERLGDRSDDESKLIDHKGGSNVIRQDVTYVVESRAVSSLGTDRW